MFGDGEHTRVVSPRAALNRLRDRLRGLDLLRGAPAIERHGALVAAFLDAAELAQGLIDERFEARGWIDAADPISDACAGVLGPLARAVVHSWEIGCAPANAADPALVEPLLRCALPETITCRHPEGFALDGAYPELWAAAAKQIGARELRCVGLRSIGTALAPIVQASVRSTGPLLTVRPLGPSGGPSDARAVHVDEALARALTRGGPQVAWAIAGEGPDRSDSAYSAVAELLQAHGVPAERIHVLPSHAPAPEAIAPTRPMWRRARRHQVTFDELFLSGDSPNHLSRWFEDLTGLVERFDELTGGVWRSWLCADPGQWPPVQPFQERRKFLLRSERGDWLLRFCGLGPGGAAAFNRARAIADGGFAPPVIALRHGFSLERWETGARLLMHTAVSRRRLVHRVGAYLGFRARCLPADPEAGAPVTALYQLARHHAQLTLGEAAAQRVAAFEPMLGELAEEVRRVDTDNRLQTWEWLVTKDARILKTDGADHCRGRDLVGSQDLAWDLAGAQVELELSETQTQRLIDVAVDHGGRRPSPALFAFCRTAYLSFQLGDLQRAIETSADPAERRRLRAHQLRYAQAYQADRP